MDWLKFLHHNKKSTNSETLISSKLLDSLRINASLDLEQYCYQEIQSYLETTYTPLPQRIFSIGEFELTPSIKIKRYYLIDDDTWLQISYDQQAIQNIILFYWVHAKTIQPTELSQGIKAPLTSLQWEHQGNLFDRCWRTPTQNTPLEITEDIRNAQMKYKLTSHQMLFSRALPSNRKEYWFYSLEQPRGEACYQQTIAQGFSLLEKELVIN